MHCTCDRARREAREETLREVIQWHRKQAAIRKTTGTLDPWAHEHAAEHFDDLLDAQEIIIYGNRWFRDGVEVPAPSQPAMSWGPSEDGGLDG
jgi:hypothetical protein